MSTLLLAPIEAALASDASPHDVLDLVDSVIEEATGDADEVTLVALADRLDSVAAERGGEWRGLAIAAMRARALAAPPGEDGTALGSEVVTAEAPAPPPAPLTPASGEQASQAEHGGFWIRTGAFLLDCALLGAGVGLVALITPDNFNGTTALEIAVFGLPLAYFAGMHALSNGATVGEKVCKVAVRSADGSSVGLGRATGRVLLTWLLWSTFILGLVDLILLGTDKKKRSLHDKIAGTVVVRTRGAPSTFRYG